MMTTTLDYYIRLRDLDITYDLVIWSRKLLTHPRGLTALTYILCLVAALTQKSCSRYWQHERLPVVGLVFLFCHNLAVHGKQI